MNTTTNQPTYNYTFTYCYGGAKKGDNQITVTVEATSREAAQKIFDGKYNYEEIISITDNEND